MVVINSLKFNDVTLKFGGITALNNVSFEVMPKHFMQLSDQTVQVKHQFLIVLVVSTDLQKAL